MIAGNYRDSLGEISNTSYGMLGDERAGLKTFYGVGSVSPQVKEELKLIVHIFSPYDVGKSNFKLLNKSQQIKML